MSVSDSQCPAHQLCEALCVRTLDAHAHAPSTVEIPFTAPAAHKRPNQRPGRLVVRRFRDPAPRVGHPVRRLVFHEFFATTTLDTITAGKTPARAGHHRQVHADLKNSALAHPPSGKFTANAARLVLAVIAFNLTRAAATLARPAMAKATPATIRRKPIEA